MVFATHQNPLTKSMALDLMEDAEEDLFQDNDFKPNYKSLAGNRKCGSELDKKRL
jgi:hypothetical protein